MFRVCFTINPNRTTGEFNTYHQLIKESLFQGIEIFYPYNKSLEVVKTYEENVRLLLEYPLEVVLHLPYGPLQDLCNLNEYEEVMKTMKKAIDFGQKLNVKKFTLHLGYQTINGEKRIRSQLYEHLKKTLKELCRYASFADIMIENMPGSKEMGYSPSEIKKLIEDTNEPNLKFILDTGHAHLSAYGNIQYLDELKNYLAHLHLSDNDQTRDQHAPLGSGTIDFGSIFKKLKDLQYQGLLCLEIIFNDASDLRKYHETLTSLIEKG